MTETDISKVLIEGEYATIMGVKYKRVEEPKTAVEEAYKDWWGEYPSTNESVSETEDMRWAGFQAGFQAAYEEKVREDDYYNEVAKPKPQTLFANLDPYSNVDREHICSIVEDWLPKPQSAAGSQNVYVECSVEGFNDCLTKIKGMLR